MLQLSLWRLFIDKSTSCKSKSNIPRVFNAPAPTTTLYMSYTSLFIHQPQLSLLNSNQPFLFYSIRRLWDCHRRLRTFLYLVQRQFTSLGTIDGQHSQVGCGQPVLQAFPIELSRESQSRSKKRGEGEGRRGNACSQTPGFWKTPLDISRFG